MKPIVYCKSEMPVQKGYRVSIDSYNAIVEEACFAHSQLAREYDCEQTGGLLVLYDDGVRTLEPADMFDELTMVCDQ